MKKLLNVLTLVTALIMFTSTGFAQQTCYIKFFNFCNSIQGCDPDYSEYTNTSETSRTLQATYDAAFHFNDSLTYTGASRYCWSNEYGSECLSQDGTYFFDSPMVGTDCSWDVLCEDQDADGILNEQDNCPLVANPSQSDCDEDGTGDLCDPDYIDADSDGYGTACDNCPAVANGPDMGSCYNYLTEEVGSPCSTESCGSSWYTWCDDFQKDIDKDSIGDVCDNCPNNCNTRQLDADGDGEGDVCDDTPGCGGCGQPACEAGC